MNKKQEAAGDKLLRAVGKWVEAMGGKAVVAGGIEIQQFPDDMAYTFRVAVRVTGRKPVKDPA